MNKVTKRKDGIQVDPRAIIVKEGFNVREDMGDLQALSESIVAIGLQVPLMVKKVRGEEQYELVDGHRRLAAIMLAIENGHDIKYVDTSTFIGNEEDRIFSMIATGVGQKTLNEVEQSEAIKRLTMFGYSVEEIAKKIGKSVPHVYNLVKISSLPKLIKEKISQGLISATVVLQIVREKDNVEEQIAIVESAINNAQEKSKDGVVKKATAKNVDGMVKVKSPMQKLKEVKKKLEQLEIVNDKTNLLNQIFEALNTKEVDEIVEMFEE
jgi:ParB family transcriptional regulator, chromosome partitioning protein